MSASEAEQISEGEGSTPAKGRTTVKPGPAISATKARARISPSVVGKERAGCTVTVSLLGPGWGWGRACVVVAAGGCGVARVVVRSVEDGEEGISISYYDYDSI